MNPTLRRFVFCFTVMVVFGFLLTLMILVARAGELVLTR